jgi:hypothetical protein
MISGWGGAGGRSDDAEDGSAGERFQSRVVRWCCYRARMRCSLRLGVCRAMPGCCRLETRSVTGWLGHDSTARRQHFGSVGCTEHEEDGDGVGRSFTWSQRSSDCGRAHVDMRCSITARGHLHRKPHLQLSCRVEIWTWVCAISEKGYLHIDSTAHSLLGQGIFKFSGSGGGLQWKGGDGNQQARCIWRRK